MKPLALAVGGVALVFGSVEAQAAALEQSPPSTVRILYEEGSYAEFGIAFSDPDQSGEGADLSAVGGPAFLPGDTGDLFESRWNLSAAFKNRLNARLSYAILFDQPFGADTDYGEGTFPPGFTYEGSLADLDTNQVTGVAAYDVTDNVKLFAGLRAQRLEAEAAIPFISGYSVEADADWGYGYLAGAAYARPEIALRVALTYYSEIEHDLDTAEFTLATGAVDTETEVSTPQSVTLDFQTGVAPGTLVFGSVRWVDWSSFAIEPPVYGQATAALLGAPRALVDYEDDWWTYTLGVGRQLTDDLSGALSLSYEPDVGGVLTTLGPYDGRTIGTAALSYDYGPMTITGGVSYGVLGDTTNLLDTDFNDGSVWGVGLRVGFRL
jgi:long-chain fatty acid transport protein